MCLSKGHTQCQFTSETLRLRAKFCGCEQGTQPANNMDAKSAKTAARVLGSGQVPGKFRVLHGECCWDGLGVGSGRVVPRLMTAWSCSPTYCSRCYAYHLSLCLLKGGLRVIQTHGIARCHEETSGIIKKPCKPHNARRQ